MQKNKIYLLAAATLATMTLSSCLFEEEDYFDKTPSKRIDAYNDELVNILSSAEKGWCIQYFPNDTTRGYNVMADFTKSGICHSACIFGRRLTTDPSTGDLTVSWALTEENPDLYRESNCLYEIKRQNGPVLAMTSYNEIFSTFVEPSKDGLGLGGDDHFVLLSASADEILLKGERNGGRIHMVPATDEWKAELTARYNDYQNIFKRGITTFKMLAGDDVLVCSEGNSTGILQSGHAYTTNGQTVVLGIETIPFIVTANGIRFQKDFTRNNVSANELTYNANRSALVSADGQMQIIPEYEAYLSSHDEVWELDSTSISGDVRATLDVLTNAMTSAGFTNVKVGFGRSNAQATSGSKVWGMTAYGKRRVNRKTYEYTYVLGYDVDASQPGKVTMKLEETQRDKSYLDNIASGSYQALNEPMLSLAKALEGTYEVSVNNYFAPDTAFYKSSEISFKITK